MHPHHLLQGLPDKAEIAALVGDWNAALATLDPEAVADLYAPDATLLPTVSNQVRALCSCPADLGEGPERRMREPGMHVTSLSPQAAQTGMP